MDTSTLHRHVVAQTIYFSHIDVQYESAAYNNRLKSWHFIVRAIDENFYSMKFRLPINCKEIMSINLSESDSECQHGHTRIEMIECLRRMKLNAIKW